MHNTLPPLENETSIDHLLRQWYVEEGLSIAEIARRLHRRKSTVAAWLDAAGIPRRRRGPRPTPLPPWDRAKLWQLVRAKGMAYVRAFAQSHGVNSSKLRALLGITRLERGAAHRYRVILHDREIRAAYDAGVSVSELARRYECSRRAIAYSLNRTLMLGANAQTYAAPAVDCAFAPSAPIRGGADEIDPAPPRP